MPYPKRNPQKKVGIRGDFHNPAFPGYASTTKQLLLEESFLDEADYKPLQGTPEEEIDLLRSLFPPTWAGWQNRDFNLVRTMTTNTIRRVIDEKDYKEITPILYQEMEFIDRYIAVYDLILFYFKPNSIINNTPPQLPDRYQWTIAISDEFSARINPTPALKDGSSETTLGRGSPYAETSASAYTPSDTPSDTSPTQGSIAPKQRSSISRKVKAPTASEHTGRKDKIILHKSTTPNNLKVKTAIQTAASPNSQLTMENSFNHSPLASPNPSQAPPETVTTLVVHQGDSNSTWANSQEAEEEIEFEHNDAQNDESKGVQQDSLKTNRFIRHMTQLPTNNDRHYSTIDSLLETETEDDDDDGTSTATERTTKSSNTHTVTGSSNQTEDRPAPETSATVSTPTDNRPAPETSATDSTPTDDRPAPETSATDSRSDNTKEITKEIAAIESHLGLFVDPPEENPHCHEVLERLISLNDLFRVEHEDRVNQIIQKDLIL